LINQKIIILKINSQIYINLKKQCYNHLMIRKAQPDDIEQIKQIYFHYLLDTDQINEQNQDYIAQVEQTGFTVSPGKTDLLNRIKQSQIFNVLERNDKILGYIDLNKEIYFPEKATNISWTDQNLKSTYFHDQDSIALHHIAVLPEFKQQGFANKLFDHAMLQLKELRKKHLFAIVTTGPVVNKPSIIFHQKMGFKQVCQTAPIDLFGLKGYESVLFYRKIS